MNTDRYRLTRRQHFRSYKREGDPTPQLIRYVKGDVLVPTDTELRIHKTAFDRCENQQAPLTVGLIPVEPVAGGTAVQTAVQEPSATVTEVSLQEKAEQILKQPLQNIREAIRQADAELLAIMADIENLKTPPRLKVAQALATRRKALAGSEATVS